ncbi:hypothetical protein DSECCO2_606230 [anaerobic digester metagenome]
MHHRVDQPVAEELLLDVIENLLAPEWVEADPIVGDDRVCRTAERYPCFIAGEVTGRDAERLKEPFFDLQEEFVLSGGEHGLDDLIGVLMRRAVVGHPDIGIRFVHRVELDLLHPR